jgi:hypothetical protein
MADVQTSEADAKSAPVKVVTMQILYAGVSSKDKQLLIFKFLTRTKIRIERLKVEIHIYFYGQNL